MCVSILPQSNIWGLAEKPTDNFFWSLKNSFYRKKNLNFINCWFSCHSGFKALWISTSSNLQQREYSNIICDRREKWLLQPSIITLAFDFMSMEYCSKPGISASVQVYFNGLALFMKMAKGMDQRFVIWCYFCSLHGGNSK